MKERKQIIVELFNDGKWWCKQGPPCNSSGICSGHDTFYDWADATQKLYVPMNDAERRVAGGKSGEEKTEREVVEQCIAVVEMYKGAKSEIGEMFNAGWNTCQEAILKALKELANR